MAADGTPVEGSLYFYAPTKIAPPIFAACFLAASIAHVWQCFKYRSWSITALHPMCALMFTAGFALRIYDAWNFDNIKTFVASNLLIYCAPPLLELANYHVLGRILYYVPYFAPLHPGRTLTTFGLLSAGVEVMNALGVSYLLRPESGESRQNIGYGLMKASLICQLGVISIFCVISGVFHRRCVRAGITSRQVQGPLWTMYISMTLILIRTIYRIVEHFGTSRVPANPRPNWDPMSLSPIVRYEWFFWVFEASLMLMNTVLWNVRHPRRYLPEDYHVYLAQDGKTELKGPGWKDEMPWFMTFIDPCGLTIAVTGGGRKKQQPFWETNGFEHIPLVQTASGQGKPSDASSGMYV
ncbi:RTA1 domain protein [Boeremia exigua]|uniref:RTA1 domain protein n=1 Tax=Boeremia exigua TaxID=749465 RepID=UPI001E8CE2EF|nr:RTA1 domain protein [Boeremia exigua]KAH6644253.1 RTA1 domain protein [Boeremia exigua]